MHALKWIATGVVGIALSASALRATVIFSDNFESYTTGSTLGANGYEFFPDSGVTGTAVVAAPGPSLVTSGTKSAQLTPPAGTAFQYAFQYVDVLDLSTEMRVEASANVSIASPVTGTANRGVVAGITAYDVDGAFIADMLLYYDPQHTLVPDVTTANYFIFVDYATFPGDTVGGSLGYVLGNVPSADLTSYGFSNLAMSANFASGGFHFYLDGQELPGSANGSGANFTPGTFNGFGEIDLTFSRGATGGILPRIFMDDVLVETTAPEPTSIATLGLGGLLLRRRRA